MKKWRIFESSLDFDYETIKIIIECVLLMHNFLITDEMINPQDDPRYANNVNFDEAVEEVNEQQDIDNPEVFEERVEGDNARRAE